MSNVIPYRTFFNRREAAKDAGVMMSQVDLAKCASQLQDAVDKLYDRFVGTRLSRPVMNETTTFHGNQTIKIMLSLHDALSYDDGRLRSRDDFGIVIDVDTEDHDINNDGCVYSITRFRPEWKRATEVYAPNAPPLTSDDLTDAHSPLFDINHWSLLDFMIRLRARAISDSYSVEPNFVAKAAFDHITYLPHMLSKYLEGGR